MASARLARRLFFRPSLAVRARNLGTVGDGPFAVVLVDGREFMVHRRDSVCRARMNHRGMGQVLSNGTL